MLWNFILALFFRTNRKAWSRYELIFDIFSDTNFTAHMPAFLDHLKFLNVIISIEFFPTKRTLDYLLTVSVIRVDNILLLHLFFHLIFSHTKFLWLFHSPHFLLSHSHSHSLFLISHLWLLVFIHFRLLNFHFLTLHFRIEEGIFEGAINLGADNFYLLLLLVWEKITIVFFNMIDITIDLLFQRFWPKAKIIIILLWLFDFLNNLLKIISGKSKLLIKKLNKKTITLI